MAAKKNFFVWLTRLLFCNVKSGEFSLTKAGMVVMNGMAFLFLIVMIICDWKGHSLSGQTVDYAKGLFGFGSPISFATYLIGRIATGGQVEKKSVDPAPPVGSGTGG